MVTERKESWYWTLWNAFVEMLKRLQDDNKYKALFSRNGLPESEFQELVQTSPWRAMSRMTPKWSPETALYAVLGHVFKPFSSWHDAYIDMESREEDEQIHPDHCLPGREIKMYRRYAWAYIWSFDNILVSRWFCVEKGTSNGKLELQKIKVEYSQEGYFSKKDPRITSEAHKVFQLVKVTSGKRVWKHIITEKPKRRTHLAPSGFTQIHTAELPEWAWQGAAAGAALVILVVIFYFFFFFFRLRRGTGGASAGPGVRNALANSSLEGRSEDQEDNIKMQPVTAEDNYGSTSQDAGLAAFLFYPGGEADADHAEDGEDDDSKSNIAEGGDASNGECQGRRRILNSKRTEDADNEEEFDPSRSSAQ
ncbi:unnamed protein product [Amoebophrya sp. A25]|nr:unnamed protein product [Amoebophrya sp. A25]|eukprot:GSA25T00010881001.1